MMSGDTTTGMVFNLPLRADTFTTELKEMGREIFLYAKDQLNVSLPMASSCDWHQEREMFQENKEGI